MYVTVQFCNIIFLVPTDYVYIVFFHYTLYFVILYKIIFHLKNLCVLYIRSATNKLSQFCSVSAKEIFTHSHMEV
jgi:hypothetical protein